MSTEAADVPIDLATPKPFFKPKAAAKPDPDAEPADPVKYTFTLYRCCNCKDSNGEPGFNFSLQKDEAPICPRCKCRMGEGRGALIQKISVIHWALPHEDADHVTLMACTGKAVAGSTRISGEPRAVTCPACIAKLEQHNASGTPFDPNHDFTIDAPTV